MMFDGLLQATRELPPPPRRRKSYPYLRRRTRTECTARASRMALSGT
jgi:hypothetical protein